MIRTFKFKLEPTKEQIEKIEWTLWKCREFYNTMLEQRMFTYKHRGISLSYYDQKAELPILKKEIPEYKLIHSQALQHVVERLDKAYKGFFARVRRGEKAGFPRFQGKNRYDSFTYAQSGFSIEGKYLRLSKIGEVRIKLHRQIKGKIKTCTIKRKNGNYYACFSCEVEVQPQSTGKAIGIDLGVAHLAITSEGKFHEHPKYLRKSECQLKRLQRIVSRRKKGSNRRKKAVLLLAKKHEYIANQRKDNAHKVSRQWVDNYDRIAFEDLNIKGMVKNHNLAKSIGDSGWKQLVQYTQYKAEYAGKRVVLVNPHQTSQVCSECGAFVKKTLSERMHVCSCGYTDHRDVNAAKNVLRLALQVA